MSEQESIHRPAQLKHNDAENANRGKFMSPPAFQLKADGEDGTLKNGSGAIGEGNGKDESFGGKWEAPTYGLISSGLKLGANIEVQFHPNETVDATKIGLIQTAKAIKNNGVSYIGDATREEHGIKSEDAIETDNVTKETDEGTHIDQLGDFSNPLYATGATKAGDDLASTATNSSWGQHGWRYKDAGGAEKKQSATLKDAPEQSGVDKDSSNTFEVAAVALSGTQKDTYFGSVKWGWKTDSDGNHTKIPFEVIHKGAPSSSFFKAGEKWNAGTTKSGDATIDMPIVDVQVAKEDFTSVLGEGNLGPAIPVAKGTRLQVMDPLTAQNKYGVVKIVDGPQTGTIVHVSHKDWPHILDERA